MNSSPRPSILHGGSLRGGPYRYGEKKWEDHLLDIQSAIHSAREASTLQNAAMYGELTRQSALLSGIEQGISTLHGDLLWGFTLLADAIGESNRFLEQISSKLDEISETLKSPTVTQAREYFRIGQDRMQRGLYSKARQSFLQAEERNDVDCLLQLQFGKLHLYGRNDEESVVDLPEAQRRLALASKYAASDRQLGKLADRCGREAQVHWGISHYLKSSDARRDGSNADADTELEKAVAVLSPPRSRGASFLRARCYAVQGKVDAAANELREVADGALKYFGMAAEDPDFAILHDQIAQLKARALSEPLPKTRRALDELAATSVELTSLASPASPFVPAQPLSDLTAELLTLEATFRRGSIGYRATVARAIDIRSRALQKAITSYDAEFARRKNAHAVLRSDTSRAETLKWSFDIATAATVGTATFVVGIMPPIHIGTRLLGQRLADERGIMNIPFILSWLGISLLIGCAAMFMVHIYNVRRGDVLASKTNAGLADNERAGVALKAAMERAREERSRLGSA